MPTLRQLAFTWLSTAALATAADLPMRANLVCPVTAGEETEARFSTVFEGRTVNFCCGKCRAKFEANPTPYLPALREMWSTNSTSANPPAKPTSLGKQLGRLHPLAVHFPVALILTAGLAELGAVLRRKDQWRAFARFSITLGAIGALLAAPLGWMAGGPPGPDTLTEWHRWLGVATCLASISAAALAHSRWRTAYGVSLLASVSLVTATGHLGGLLAYGENALRIWK